MAASIRLLAGVLVALFVFFAWAHHWTLPADPGSSLARLSGASAAFYGLVFAVWPRLARRLGGRGTYLVASLMMLVAGFNCAAHLALTQDPVATAYFALLAVVVGIFIPSLVWATPTLVLLTVGWGVAASRIPDFPFVTYGVILTGAVSTALVVALLRRRLYAHVLTVQAQSEMRARELELSERRLQLAQEGSNDGLYDWDLERNEVFWSERARAMLSDDHGAGLPPSFQGFVARVHVDDVDRVRNSFQAFLQSDSLLLEDEFRLRCSDDSYRWVLARGACERDERGRVVRLAGSITDMSRRGVFDALTGLPNRRLLLDRLGRLTSRPRGTDEEETFSVLFLDLDDFKIVNDSLGHQTGDALLLEVARRLQGCVRGSDTVARLGGDEFVVLLEKVKVPEGVQITLDRIVAKLAEPFHLDGRELYIRPSIGVVMDTHHYARPDEILRDADTAMYRAKEAHPDYVVFDTTMRERLTERLRLETELRRALAREEFILHFQTIVSLQTGAVEGLEALVRWQHPDRGLLMPGEFIEVMEETGLVIPLGALVLRLGCQQMMEWFAHMRPDDMPYLSVNLSGKHLAQENPAGVVEEILAETGFPAHRLRIEITESAIIESPRRAAAALGQMKLLGVRVLMDDFGTGQSSLAYLQKLPIDTLKIDRSFISTMTAQREGEELVRTIVRMADSLGLNVVAEGIETDEQARMLRAMRCGSGQGYLFARPAELGLVSLNKGIGRGTPGPAEELEAEIDSVVGSV